MSKGGPLTYTPERGKYKEKSDAVILGRIRTAGEMASLVTGLTDQVKSEYTQNTNTIDFMVDLIQGKHVLGIPADKRYVNFDAKSAKPADIIFRVLGMLMTTPKPEYIHPDGSSKDDGLRDSIEGHLGQIYPWMWRKYQTRWDIQSLFWQLLAGRSYLQQSFLPFYWDKQVRSRKDGEKIGKTDAPDEIAGKNGLYNARVAGYKGYMGPPWFMESLDPRMVFPIMTPMGPEAYVKKYRVQRFELQESFQRLGKDVVLDKDGKVISVQDLGKASGVELPVQSDSQENNSSIDYYEYIDDTMVYYVVGSEVVHRYQHNGGIKIFPAYGLQTGFKEYNLMAVGILWAVRNELPQFDFMRTLWVQKAYLDVFPQLFAQLATEDQPLKNEKGDPEAWNIEPMTVKQIRGQLVNALKDASAGVDFRAAVEMFAGDIDLATIPGLARGVAGAQQPGYAINQLSQSMRTLWKPIIESRELQFSGMYEHYLWGTKNIVQERTTVFGATEDAQNGGRTGLYFALEPDKIEDFFRVDAHLEPELPIDTQGNMMTYAQLLEKGLVTNEEWVRDGLKKSNPVAHREQAELDAARRAWAPKAIEDAMALGRVELTNAILKERGLDKLNSIGNMDVMALKAARAQQPLPPGQPAPAGQPPAAAPPGPGGSPTPPGAPGGGPAVVASTAGQTGSAIPPSVGVTGANPNNPTPAFRG
jgi:hypothetical protein